MNPNISSRQFEFHKAEPRSMWGDGAHTLNAIDAVGPHRNPERIGFLRWSHKTGEISSIEVFGGHQRQGVATGLWNEAHRIAGETRGVKPPRHSPDRTDAGEAWARSLGGRLPRRA
jgi:ribosomal protein S18 acetylase RimI-like enzyme